MKTNSKLMWLELIGGVFGWVWIGASLAMIYFLVMAIFSDGSWSRAFWALGIAIVAKWLLKGFRDNQIRVQFEADLVAKGYSPAAAAQEWLSRYTGKG